jgi:2-octaprenyl-3-methyl-6-methoxy-1,4-benzoquinol hydroxylase
VVKLLFDVCIVGGGMVGSVCALGLAQLGLSVALIERYKPAAYSPEQAPDLRVSAISYNSERYFQELGVWSDIEQMRLCPYRRLSVWENPKARTDFNCVDIGVSHLGHIVENRIIQLALHNACSKLPNIHCFWQQDIQSLELQPWVKVVLTNQQIIEAKIIIGADGLNSQVRLSANIGVQGWQYTQHAMGINIKIAAEQQDITWQQFTAQGPLAFLPLYGQHAALVWYNHPNKINQLKSLSNAQLKQQIIAHFPPDLMDFEIIDFASFPLTRMHANQYVKNNVVLIGDAAHSINPLAGQGVNLGFKDVEALVEVFAKQFEKIKNTQQTAGQSGAWLQEYEKRRRADNLLMMSVMDSLYMAFGNDLAPIKLLRNIGLTLADRAGPLKTKAMKYAMGF